MAAFEGDNLMNLSLIIFIQYLLVTFDGLTMGLFFEIGSRKTNEKENSMVSRGRILAFWMMELVLMLFKLTAGTPTTPFWLNVLQFAAEISLLRILYHYSWPKVAIWLAAALGCGFLAEITMIFAHPEIVKQAINWTRENALALLIPTELLALVFRLLMALAIRRKDGYGWKDPQILLYPLIALGVLFVYPILSLTSQANQAIFLQSYLPQITIFSLIVLTYVIGRWMHARFRMNIEKNRNQSTENRIQENREDEKLARLHHDAGNISLTIAHLIESGQEEEALRILESLSSEMTESDSV